MTQPDLSGRNFVDREDLEKEISSFKAFAFKKNMLELSIAFILGGAFNKVVTSISQNLIMPVVNMLAGLVNSKTGTDWRKLTIEPLEGLHLEVGEFLSSFFDFMLTALVLYIIFTKIIRKVWATSLPEKKDDTKGPPPVPICFPE